MYSTKDIAEILNVTDRTVRRYLKTFVSFDNKAIKVSSKMLLILKKEYLRTQDADNKTQDADNKTQDADNYEYDIVEGFSNEEFQEFQKRLIEYPILKEELEYHRKSAESHQKQMELILLAMRERNFLEAKNSLNK